MTITAGGAHHDRGNEEQRHRRAEVGFGEDQGDEADDRDADRQQRVAKFVDAMHPAFEDRRDEEDRGKLRDFRRLDADTADPEPPPCAVDRRAEEHRHQREHHHHETRPDERRLAIAAVIDAHHDVEQGQAHQRPHRLADQEHRRAAVFLQRERGRRAVDHHDAEADEQDRRDEKSLVRLEFARQKPVSSPQSSVVTPPTAGMRIFRNTPRVRV
jgi:hypothetical protein